MSTNPTTPNGPPCHDRGWYQDPSGNWRFISPGKAGDQITAGMGAHTLGIYGSDGVIYWICDQCRQTPPATPCNSWPGLYRRPVDPLAAAFWDTYYVQPDQNGNPPPAKIKMHGHDGNPATFQAHFPSGTQSYFLHTIEEIPEPLRTTYKRAYQCDQPTPPPILPTFCGQDTLTRNQAAAMIWKAAQSMIANPPASAPPPATGTVFSDVPADGQFSPYIEDLQRRGVLAGKSPCQS